MLGFTAVSEVPLSTLPSAGGVTYNDAINFTGIGTFSAASNGIFAGVIDYVGVGTLSTIGTVTYLSFLDYVGIGIFSAQPIQSVLGSANWSVSATFNALASVGIFSGSVAWNATGLFLASSLDAYEAYLDGLREYEVDFESPPSVVIPVGLSTTLRPDAITFDLKTAFTIGPEFEAVPGGSILDRPWYVRVDGLNVYTARANDANNAWEAENLLFFYSGVEITSFDAAFEQNARFVISAERPTGAFGAPEIWIFWYNPSLASYAFENFGPGRTPQVVLDNPFETVNSDVLVGYLLDGQGFKIRVQSELYATAHATPWTSTDNWYLEELARLKGFRLGAFLSYHDPGTGRYRIGRLESLLYPIYPVGDAFTLGAKFNPGSSLTVVAILHNAQIEDAFELTLALFAGSSLVDIVITFTNFVDDAFEMTTDLFAGSSLVTIVIFQDQIVEDAFEMIAGLFAGSSLATVVIVQNEPVDDAFELTANIQGGSLA